MSLGLSLGRLGLGSGDGSQKKGLPDWEMTFTEEPDEYFIGWKDMPV